MVAPMMLTVTVDWVVPPLPVQLSVKLVALARALVASLPAVARVPVQPPDALQEVAFVVFHVNVLLPPLATLVGDAEKLTVGLGTAVTVTVVLAWRVPPAPVQLSVNVVLVFSAPVPWVPDSALLPLQPPDAVHEVALVEDQLNVLLPPLLTELGDAEIVTVGAGVWLVTVTDALAWRVPPAPVQLSVNDVLAVKAPVDWLPESALLPLQPPDAVHEVALVEDQLKVLLPPLLTEVGDADSETVGAGVELPTVIVTLRWVVPPAPVQLSVKVVVAVSGPELPLPESGTAPLNPPDAVHEVAFVDDHVSVLLPPLVTVVGDADSDTVGAAGAVPETETMVLARAVAPKNPVQVIVNVAEEFSAPVLCVPEVALEPLHAPDAVHDCARVLDQVNVLAPPGLTVPGLALIVAVGDHQFCANACGPGIRMPTNTSRANRSVIFMWGDIRRNVSDTVCLQTATSSERIPTWVTLLTC